MAFFNAVICFLIAYPVAYFLAFHGKRFKNLFLFLLIVPFWTNFLLHVYAWFFVLEREGFLNTLSAIAWNHRQAPAYSQFFFCHHDHDGILLLAFHGLAHLFLS